MSATLDRPPAPSPFTTPTANPFLTEQAVMLAQAGYYVLTGLWPIFSIVSFQAVTGPKTDLWLVRTVGVLITVIGGVILLAAVRNRAPVEVVALSIGTAAALVIVNLIIVFTGTVSMVYLLDAAVELGLIAWWVVLLKPPSPKVVQIPAPGAPPSA